MFGRKAAVIAALQNEIAILQERLCPFGQHDWSIVDSEYSLYAEGCGRTTYTCRCKRCGKVKTQYEED